MSGADRNASMDVEAALETQQGTQQQSGISWVQPHQLLFYCPRLVGEIARRVKMEFTVELPMLKQRWLIIMFGLVMQYVHGIFTQLAHRMHQPQEQPLHDIGFDMLPELGPQLFWVSEAIFGSLFAAFVLWTFTPFVMQRKRFYTVVMWSRLLMVLVVCQALRIVTFTATQLPGPSYHCRAGESSAVRPWPQHWSGHIIIDVQRQVSRSCGDLVFSSHTIFMLTGILAYNEYGSQLIMKAVAWTCGAIVSALIIASRKHYTVDIVVAWYTVPLVFYTLHRRWTTRRPMSELLGALGENDEPDPATPDSAEVMDTTILLEQVQVRVDKHHLTSHGSLHSDGKAILTYSKDRASSGKLNHLLAYDGDTDSLKPAMSALSLAGSHMARTRSLADQAVLEHGSGGDRASVSASPQAPQAVVGGLTDRLHGLMKGSPTTSTSGCRIS
ncbi:PAP2 superfamily C-terminal-domain-containing protein [Haematococcus lacustris]